MPKISQLPEVQTVNAADNFIIEQGGETKRAPTTTLTDALNAQISQALTNTNNAVSQAQSAVTQAQSAINTLPDLQLKKKFYVDAVNGNDANAGSSASPYKTIKKAIESVPTSGFGEIILYNSQTHIINNTIYPKLAHFLIRSKDITGNGYFSSATSAEIKYNCENCFYGQALSIDFGRHNYSLKHVIDPGGFYNVLYLSTGNTNGVDCKVSIYGDIKLINGRFLNGSIRKVVLHNSEITYTAGEIFKQVAPYSILLTNNLTFLNCLRSDVIQSADIMYSGV